MRLLVHVEGQTEEEFVNEALAPYLIDRGFSTVSARLLGNSRMRYKRGGIASWSAVRLDISGHLKGDGGAVATTMVDFYGLPGGRDGWPGRDQAVGLSLDERARVVEESLHADFQNFMGNGFDGSRFVPYIAMHEFEGLLFSDCDALARGLGAGGVAARLHDVRARYASPEHINDSPTTAPSKRIAEIHPAYQKALHGPLAVLEMGIDVIRKECPGFNNWIARLIAIV